ncbi:MAG: chromate resistance protein, partial [Thermoplasmataceae archaeon]
ISRFIDNNPEFIFAPSEMVLEVSRRENAIPFDTPGAELFHYKENGKEFSSFDAIIRKYHLEDPALLELARIVRGADVNAIDAPAESAGLEAAAIGFRDISRDDHENMRLQFPLYDALYAYVKGRMQGRLGLEHAHR